VDTSVLLWLLCRVLVALGRSPLPGEDPGPDTARGPGCT